MVPQHISPQLSAALVQLFRAATAASPGAAVEQAMEDVYRSCSATDHTLPLEQLRGAALEAQLEASQRRRRASESQALLRLAHELLAAPDLGGSLESIVGATRSLMASDVAHINYRPDDDGDYHSVRSVQGEMTEAFRRLHTPLGAGLTGVVAQTKSPYISSDYLSDPRIVHSRAGDESVRADGLRTMIGMPVFNRDSVIAVLIASYREPREFSDDELSLLVSLSKLAGSAIATAHSREKELGIARQLHAETKVLGQRVNSLQWSADLLGDLIDAVTCSNSLQEQALIVSARFGGRAVVTDAGGRDLAVAEAKAWVPRSRTEASGVRDQLAVRTDSPDGPLWVLNMSIDGLPVGKISIAREALDEIEQSTLVQVGRLITQVLTRTSDGRTRSMIPKETLKALLAGEGDLADVGFVLASLPDRYAVVVGNVPKEGIGRMTRFSLELAQVRGGVAGVSGQNLLVALPGDDVNEAASWVESRLSSRLGLPVTVGASRGTKADELSAVVGEALRCANFLQLLGRESGWATVDTLGPIGLMVGSDSGLAVSDFVNQTLGSLLAYDRERGADLVATVKSYFHHNGSARSAAAELHVHPNTVLLRMQKVSALLGGDDWRSNADRRLELQLAVRLHSMNASKSEAEERGFS